MKNHSSRLAALNVQKASGDLAPFDEQKLRSSLQRSGADDHLINLVLQEMHGQVFEKIPTKALFKIAYKMLRRLNRGAAGRYSLKRAMLEMGPSGFPFERFIAELFKNEGFSTQTGVILAGQCIPHEVDVFAEKGSDLVLVECKYHAQPGAVSDVKIPLYIHSRFRDIEATAAKKGELAGRNLHFRIVTNTRFSDDAMSYARCAGLDLLAWDYPMGRGLREWIDSSGLHPITCLGSLTHREKLDLLEKGIVLCQNLLDSPEVLSKIGATENRKKLLLNEAEKVCQAFEPSQKNEAFGSPSFFKNQKNQPST